MTDTAAPSTSPTPEAVAKPTADPGALPARPRPNLTPTTDGPRLDIRPALVPGTGTAYDPMAGFDAAAVAASVGRTNAPMGGTYEAGEFRNPPQPTTPPPGVEVPADLAAAYRTYNERRQAWDDSVETVVEFQDDASQSRARRAAAIHAAGRAAAQGNKRPTIPTEVTEADEATEVQVLSAVVQARYGEAAAASRAADTLIGKYAAGWAAEVTGRYGPALDAATAAVQAAVEAVGRAEGIRHMAAGWRAHAIAEDLTQAGVRVTEPNRVRITSDLLDVITHPAYRAAEGQHRAALHLLGQTHESLGLMRACDPGAVPHADALRLPGPDEVTRRVYRAMYDGASDEQRRVARSGRRY
jgi:hypothetical protein